MTLRRLIATASVLAIVASAVSPARDGAAQPPPPQTGPAPGAPDVTPSRLSYIHGDVSFWRAGAQDWTGAKANTPLAPGDVLYTGRGGNVEIQVSSRAFVRGAEET